MAILTLYSPCKPAGSANGAGTGNLAAGTYYYRVAASGGGGENPASRESAGIAAVDTDSITLTWSEVKGADKYIIYRRSDSTWGYVGFSTSTSFTDTVATPDVGTPIDYPSKTETILGIETTPRPVVVEHMLPGVEEGKLDYIGSLPERLEITGAWLDKEDYEEAIVIRRNGMLMELLLVSSGVTHIDHKTYLLEELNYSIRPGMLRLWIDYTMRWLRGD